MRAVRAIMARLRDLFLLDRVILRKLNIIIERLATVADQTDIDRLSQQVSDSADAAAGAADNIRQDIADLKAANPGVDTAALEASVAKLGTAVGGLQELASENGPTDSQDPVSTDFS